jgi:hypothetical protein
MRLLLARMAKLGTVLKASSPTKLGYGAKREVPGVVSGVVCGVVSGVVCGGALSYDPPCESEDAGQTSRRGVVAPGGLSKERV